MRRAPRRSEAFRRWCDAPLSTLYPRATSDSSSGDSSERPLHSSSHSAGPSRKRCRSLVDYVPSSMPVIRSLAPTPADLLLPRKRFRDSYSFEASIEEDTKIDLIETEVDMKDDTKGYEADTSAGDTVEVGIDSMSALIVAEEIVEPAGEDSSDSSFEDIPRDVIRGWHCSSDTRDDTRDGIVGIETAQRRLEADQFIARGQRVSMIERIDNLRLENLKVRAMLDIERDRVNSLRLHMSFLQEEFRQGSSRTMTITRSGMTPEAIEELVNRRVEEALAAHEATRAANALETENRSQNGSDGDNENGGNGNGRNENPDENGRVFHINNCLEKSQVKYATCTLLDSALTWWNSHKRTIGTEAAFALSWRELMKLMTERFQELTMMCTKMVPEEEDWVEKFIGGLPNNIKGNVIAAEPTRLQDAVRIANNLMDQKLKGYAVRNAENKKRLNNNYRNNHGQQPPHKQQNTRG
ncbi:hypothetical protein Tco_0833747 [Tanacetum coccineum]